MTKKRLSTLGLVFITFLSAIQYVFLQNVPDTVSTFFFIFVTNLIGLVLLGATQLKKLRTISRETMKKGFIFGMELTGFNFFLLIGSRSLDPVIISSVVSMYFMFIPPMLILLKRKVNFFSGIAIMVAIIALILMFGADTEALFASRDILYLLLADIFFAAYIVSVSILGEDEDSMQLTLAQLVAAMVLALGCWGVELLVGRGGVAAFITDPRFWVSACFIGVFIRAVYGLLQITCQKYVPAINASLIFASEIMITLVFDPILSRIMGTTYTPINAFQIVGGVLFVIAALLLDESVMSRLGYADLELKEHVAEDGSTVRRSSVARKMILSTLVFTLVTLVLSTMLCLSAIGLIRRTTVENSLTLGINASQTSADALTKELENKILQLTDDKAKLAEARLATYSNATTYAASYAGTLYSAPTAYPDKEVDRPLLENQGIWAMQRFVANESIPYASLRAECGLLGNMENVFAPIIEKNVNICTIYIGTENGMLVSYDPSSEMAYVEEGESYFEFADSGWYLLGKSLPDPGSYAFTDTYQDSYGRGLTITCVSPIYTDDGTFVGCVAMDILMKDLNNTMVNDGVIDPNVATMLDSEGNIIASKDITLETDEEVNIFDPGTDTYLKEVGDIVLNGHDGIEKMGSGENAIYIAYSTVDTTDWTLCLISPVYSVIEPVNEIRDSIERNTDNVVEAVVHGIMNVVQSCLVLTAVILLSVTFTVGRYSRRISTPLQQLEQDVQEISKGDLDFRTSVETDDEIGTLAKSFNDMTESLRKHMEELRAVTAKEERIAGELSVATRIQANMLPVDFPPFPERKEFDLYATMNPAKEVGGDFYDFFLIDDDHLAVVIADVSGKGVPAAMFMAISKTLIKTRALSGGTPSEILADVNEQLCENNRESMFVTVWLAIIEISTGKGVSSNAGHEHPALMRKNGSFELVKNRHSLAVAAMDGMRFRQNEFELHPGDRLYVYTDGVPEATNASDTLFGTDRMLDSLNARKGDSLSDLLIGVKADIDAFVGDAVQFDDITMVCLDYYGPQGKQNEG